MKKDKKSMANNKSFSNIFLISGTFALLLTVIYRFVFYDSYQETPRVLDTEELCVTVKGESFVMKLVEGGVFQMGNENYDAESDEKPIHNVTVNSFYLCEIEVTQKLWELVMGTNVSQQRDLAGHSLPLRGVGNSYPMYYVSWNDCQEFIQKLNQQTGKQFRLPTEAEWEYAARGGKHNNCFQYAGSNVLDNVAWHSLNSNTSTHPVKSKVANGLGIYDMSGNVWEWCSDLYSSNYYSNPADNEIKRVIRGGSWYSKASFCRVTKRHKLKPDYRDTCYGFRLAMDL